MAKLRRTLVCWWSLLSSINLAANFTVHKFFEHLGTTTDKLVFYWQGVPKITHSLVPLNDEPAHYRSERFIFTNLKFANQQLQQQLLTTKGYYHNGHHQCYKLQFKPVVNGLELHLIYDTRQVNCVLYQNFKAISGFDGFLIQITHQKIAYGQQVPDQADTSQAERTTLAPANITIALDYGHGGTDQGALGLSAQPEKIITRQVGFKLKQILVAQGYKIIETCPEDQKMELDERSYKVNFAGPVDLLVSLHANHAANPQAMGLETFFTDSQLFTGIAHSSCLNSCPISMVGARSKQLADSVHASILTHLQAQSLTDRKVRRSAAQILMGVECPAVLVELGYLSNAHEAKKLNDPAYQQRLAEGLAQGIVKYLGQ